MFELIRSQRVISGHLDDSTKYSSVSVFLGLYNAKEYLASLEEQLETQRGNFPIIVVDNQSTDDTWNAIQPWLKNFQGRILLVQNPINLGGTGTLLANLDLIPSSWVATFHQDDFYKPHHLETLHRHIETAQPLDIGFATDMGSMSATGRRTSTPPRASWFLPDKSKATMFLTNLRLHNFPFPAGAFRVSSLVDARLPWHSNAFPDTELVLNWALEGNLTHIPVETMLYRENPASESHTVNDHERDLGTYLALTRVFGLPAFGSLVEQLEVEDRGSFFCSLAEALRVRVSDERLFELLSIQVAEICANRWDYSEAQTSQVLVEFSEIAKSTRTLELLTELSNFYNLELNLEKSTLQFPPRKQILRSVQHSHFRKLIRLYGWLPHWLRVSLAKHVFKRLLRRGDSKSPWNLDWRS